MSAETRRSGTAPVQDATTVLLGLLDAVLDGVSEETRQALVGSCVHAVLDQSPGPGAASESEDAFLLIVRVGEDGSLAWRLHPLLRVVVHGRTARRVGPRLPVALTSREVDVLEQLALGGSYGDIARALYITENTVKTHVSSIYRKLGVRRRADALRAARARGMVAVRFSGAGTSVPGLPRPRSSATR